MLLLLLLCLHRPLLSLQCAVQWQRSSGPAQACSQLCTQAQGSGHCLWGWEEAVSPCTWQRTSLDCRLTSQSLTQSWPKPLSTPWASRLTGVCS